MWIALYLAWIIYLDYCETLDSWDCTGTWGAWSCLVVLGLQDEQCRHQQETKAVASLGQGGPYTSPLATVCIPHVAEGG